MPDPKRRNVSKFDGDFFARFGIQIRLIARLLADGRVSLLAKALPVFSILYLVSPLDMAIPLVDDALVIWIANTLFLDLCPPDVVAEHRSELENEASPKSGAARPKPDPEVIDADYHDKDA
ncbi:MAG: hypothetical protein KIS80_04585 [Anaerolineales bacterium]|nr:hypothetical protein [Anaerolineales bacterium]